MKITWIGIQCCIALKRLIYYILISIDLMAYTSVLNQKWIYANNHDLQKVSKTKSILFQKWQSCHAYSRVVVIHVTNNQLPCHSGQVDVSYTNVMFYGHPIKFFITIFLSIFRLTMILPNLSSKHSYWSPLVTHFSYSTILLDSCCITLLHKVRLNEKTILL